MKHSNNAARIRIFLHMAGLENEVETRMVTYDDMQTAECDGFRALSGMLWF